MLVQVLDTGHLPDGGKTLWVNDLKGELVITGTCLSYHQHQV